MIELKNITKKFNKPRKSEKHFSLKNVNIKFNKTGLIFILGESKSGKSTLLNIIGGLDTPTEGEMIINGKSTNNFSQYEYDYYRNTYVSFIFENYNLLENETVAKNINLALDLQEKKLGKGGLRRILDTVGLTDISEKRIVNTLSAGQMQRVAIARAIVKNPYVVIADEPVGNLDSVTSREIYDLLKRMSKNKLVIVATHDEEAANRYGDRIFSIKDGVVTADNKEEVITPVVENFGLIKTTMPFRKTLKYGISNLFYKKINLLFTLFFLILTFTSLGITISSKNYDLFKQHITALEKNEEKEIKIIKYDGTFDKLKQYKSIITMNFNKLKDETVKRTYLTDEDIEKLGDYNWKKEYKITQNKKNPTFEFPNSVKDDLLYYVTEMKLNFVTSDFDFNIIGTKPVNNDEIIISKYVADQIIRNGIALSDSYTLYKPTSYEQIANERKNIVITNLGSARIVGIKDDNLEDLEELKTIQYSDVVNQTLVKYKKLEYNIENTYNRIYTLDSFIQKLGLIENNISYKTSKIKGTKEYSLVDNFGYLTNNETIYTKEGIKAVNDVDENKIIISFDLLNDITDGKYIKKFEKFQKENPSYTEEDYNTFITDFLQSNDLKVSTNALGNTEYELMGVMMNKNVVKTTYYNKNYISKIIPKKLEVTSVYTTSPNQEEILKKYPIEGSNIVAMTRYSKDILNLSIISYVINIMSKYGIIACAFLSLLLYLKLLNDSIEYRKKDISLYRALGCRGKDVSTMFKLESFIMTIATIGASNYLIKYAVDYFNTTANRSLNNSIKYLTFGIEQIAIVSAVIFISILLITIIKISKISKQKAIDTIEM